MSELSTRAALLAMKCPKCHQGRMFTVRSAYNFKRMHEMPDYCEACGQSFSPEPGFYTGAMYVNYGLTLILSGITYLILEILFSVSAPVFFGVYLTILLLIGPLMFRYSRVIFLYMFVSYDKEAIKKHNLSN
ncbi:MAG TPA: DUF983 domain-containing protein [Cytophagaceae bacterium]|nr:DUF983 domain-containing protein [Cytophagaceae bacterium]